MKKLSLNLQAFLHSFLTLIYVSGIAALMNNGEKIFGQMKTMLAPIAFLLLFVFSALITGLLILGRPVYLFLEGQKKESVKLLLMTAGWLFGFLFLTFLLLVFSRL